MSFMIKVSAKFEKLLDINIWIESVAEKLNLPKSTSFAIQLCCEEAFMNIVMHSYGPHCTEIKDEDQIVLLTIDQEGRDVTLTIRDNGLAFNPLEAADPAYPSTLSEAKIGGLGISLMKKFSKNIQYESKGLGNLLAFQF